MKKFTLGFICTLMLILGIADTAFAEAGTPEHAQHSSAEIIQSESLDVEKTAAADTLIVDKAGMTFTGIDALEYEPNNPIQVTPFAYWPHECPI